MTTKNNPIPIASINFLAAWRRAHRSQASECHLRHSKLARALAHTGMTPMQIAIVTVYVSELERELFLESSSGRSFRSTDEWANMQKACADRVAAKLQPDLCAHVIQAVPCVSLSDEDQIVVNELLDALNAGKPVTITHFDHGGHSKQTIIRRE